MEILTLMTNNNCDILRKNSSPDFRVPPINLNDLPKFLLGKLRLLIHILMLKKRFSDGKKDVKIIIQPNFY